MNIFIFHGFNNAVASWN